MKLILEKFKNRKPTEHKKGKNIMKRIKLCVYNYGRIALIADFKNNDQDAYKVLHFLNEDIAKSYNGELPEKTFYFLSYVSKRTKEAKIMVDYTDKLPNTVPHVMNVKKALETVTNF